MSRAPKRFADRAVATLSWVAAAIAFGGFGWIVVDLLIGGLPHISVEFLLESPREAGRAGGILPILVSTGLVVAVAIGVALPIGLATALLLAELTAPGDRRARAVRASLDTLAGVPSIVFGLFGNALFCRLLGMGFSILSGGLTLACMVLPVLVRSVEQGLRAVPDDYRRAAAALGMTRTATLARVVLPAATPGLAVGLVLGIGRALAETAALVFTSGYVDRMPDSLLDSGRTLSVHILDLAVNVPGAGGRACAAALILLVLLLVIDGGASWTARRWLGRKVLLP